jgi:hypothetical protein
VCAVGSQTGPRLVAAKIVNMTMKARLEGDQTSCEMLEILFPTDPLVSHDSKGFFFSSPSLEAAEQSGSPWAVGAAELLISHMNGVARLRTNAFAGVKIIGYDGVPGRVQVSGVSLTSWDRNGDHGLEPDAARQEMLLAKDNVRVARAIRLLGHAGSRIDWFDLYKVYESVRADLKDGGHPELLGIWIDKNDLNTFTESANRAEISGDGARHAELGGIASGRSMTLGEGRSVMIRAVRQWLAWKISGKESTRLP